MTDTRDDADVLTVPDHYTDSGEWCRWSGTQIRDHELRCPVGCDGARHHYANDGHPECEDYTEHCPDHEGSCDGACPTR